MIKSSAIPVATYGAEVTFDAKLDPITKIFLTMSRTWLGLNSKSSARTTMAELGLYPPDIMMLEKATTFLLKLREMTNSIASTILRQMESTHYRSKWILNLRKSLRALCIDDRKIMSQPLSEDRETCLDRTVSKIRQGYLFTLLNYELQHRSYPAGFPLVITELAFDRRPYTTLLKKERILLAKFQFDQSTTPNSYLQNREAITSKSHRPCICSPLVQGDLLHLVRECPFTRSAYEVFAANIALRSDTPDQEIMDTILNPQNLQHAKASAKLLRSIKQAWDL